MARRSAGLLQLCVSTTSTGLFFCRYTRITACNIPAPDRQAETLGGINKHAKANALFARQAKIPLPVASCHCYFVYCYLTFFRLPGPCPSLHPIHYSLSTGPLRARVSNPPKTKQSNLARKQVQLLDRFNCPESRLAVLETNSICRYCVVTTLNLRLPAHTHSNGSDLGPCTQFLLLRLFRANQLPLPFP